jgi:hypothetical protein
MRQLLDSSPGASAKDRKLHVHPDQLHRGLPPEIRSFVDAINTPMSKSSCLLTEFADHEKYLRRQSFKDNNPIRTATDNDNQTPSCRHESERREGAVERSISFFHMYSPNCHYPIRIESPFLLSRL